MSTTVGERIKQAMELAKVGNKRLSGLLESRGVKGASYPSVMKYLRDETPPPLEFLSAAADICDVRQAWLAFDDGAPTEESELARVRAQFDRGGGLRFSAMVEETLATKLPGYRVLSPPAQSQLWAALLAWTRASADVLRSPDEEGGGRTDSTEQNLERMQSLSSSFGELLAAPLNARPMEDLTSRALSDYVSHMSFALLALIPDRVKDALHWPGDLAELLNEPSRVRVPKAREEKV